MRTVDCEQLLNAVCNFHRSPLLVAAVRNGKGLVSTVRYRKRFQYVADCKLVALLDCYGSVGVYRLDYRNELVRFESLGRRIVLAA